jgi:hypothetical protein
MTVKIGDDMSGEYSINQAKIFISSSAQDSLKTVRQNIKTMVMQTGHIPIMYENNFGVAGNDSIQQCLDMVRQSDIFLLLIHRKGGSFVEEYGCTVTHLEFSKALIERKEVFVFVEKGVKKLFFDNFAPPLKEMFNNKHAKPIDIKNAILDLGKQAPYSEILDNIDANIFVLLFDVYQDGFWMNEFDINGDYTEKIKQHLSEMLKKGLTYLQIENEILSNSINSKIFNDYKDLVLDTLHSIEIKTFTDWHQFLASIMEHMNGNEVFIGSGTYLERSIGAYGHCNGCTLYKRNGNTLELIRPSIGVASEEHSLLNLSEDNYYVVLTYNTKITDPNIFVNRAKMKMYITLRVNEFVLCLHFPLEKLWPEVCNQAARDDIINSKNFVILLDFIKSVLGGIKNG